MERQLINSLVGQSEVLTVCGSYFILQGNNTLGGVLLGLGIVGAITRQTLNINFVSKYISLDSNEFDE